MSLRLLKLVLLLILPIAMLLSPSEVSALGCQITGASSQLEVRADDGKEFRNIRITLTVTEADDFTLLIGAVATFNTELTIQEDVNVGGTNSLPGTNVWVNLNVPGKFPGGNYQIEAIDKNVFKGPCAGSGSFTVSIPEDPNKFEPPDTAVGNLFNPIRFGSVGEIITSLIPNLFGFAAMLTFLFLVYGGIRYALSRGDAKAADSARGIVTNAITGLVIILIVFVIFEIISTVLGFTVFSLITVVSAASPPVDIGDSFKIGSQSADSLFPDFGTLFTRLIAAAMALMGLIFFALLLWGGIRYMLSRGDEKAIIAARGTLTSAVIGLLIVLAAFAIITLIGFLTGQTSILPFS